MFEKPSEIPEEIKITKAPPKEELTEEELIRRLNSLDKKRKEVEEKQRLENERLARESEERKLEAARKELAAISHNNHLESSRENKKEKLKVFSVTILFESTDIDGKALKDDELEKNVMVWAKNEQDAKDEALMKKYGRNIIPMEDLVEAREIEVVNLGEEIKTIVIRAKNEGKKSPRPDEKVTINTAWSILDDDERRDIANQFKIFEKRIKK
jgi:hypothetical protein